MIKVFLSFLLIFLFNINSVYSVPLLVSKVSGISYSKIVATQKNQVVNSTGPSGDIILTSPSKSTYVSSVNLDGISNTTSSAASNNPLANWDFLQCDSDAYKFCNEDYRTVISNCGIADCVFPSDDGTENSIIISSINASLSVTGATSTSPVCAYYSDVDIDASSDNPSGVLTLIRSGITTRAATLTPQITNLESCYNAIDAVSECLIENLESLSLICKSIVTDSPCWAETEIDQSYLQLETDHE